MDSCTGKVPQSGLHPLPIQDPSGDVVVHKVASGEGPKAGLGPMLLLLILAPLHLPLWPLGRLTAALLWGLLQQHLPAISPVSGACRSAERCSSC